MTDSDLRDIFGGAFDESWATEAEERWGDTDAWKESQAKTVIRTKEEWAQFTTDLGQVHQRLVATFTSGLAADSSGAMALAEQHRHWVSQSWNCTPRAHRNLVDMYLADERFTKTYEDLAPGLTQWLHDAVHANADRIKRDG